MCFTDSQDSCVFTASFTTVTTTIIHETSEGTGEISSRMTRGRPASLRPPDSIIRQQPEPSHVENYKLAWRTQLHVEEYWLRSEMVRVANCYSADQLSLAEISRG